MIKIYAEEVNFWQTSQSSPDKWLERTKRQIEELGGKVLAEGFGSNDEGKAAYMIGFEIEGDKFKIIWPVLPSKNKETIAARRQAATMLYHYIKSVCLYAVIVGARTAFFSHYLLPDGRTAGQIADNELLEAVPKMLLLENNAH
jgi:hypothetical protein